MTCRAFPDDDARERLLDRAACCLSLARAFAYPDSDAQFVALRDVFADELQASPALQSPAAQAALTDFRHAMQALKQLQDLQVIYARLFLMPGDKHPSLNTGAYIDGAMGGGSVHAMETCYVRCGLEKQTGLHDLPDHITVQLEFLAWLHAAEAEGETLPMHADEFQHAFVARWVGPLRADIVAAAQRFGLHRAPYAALARLLEAMVGGVAVDVAEGMRDNGVDPEIARLRSYFAGRRLDESDLAVIREKLLSDGLPVDHLAIPVEDRDEAMGMVSLTPPEARRRSDLSIV